MLFPVYLPYELIENFRSLFCLTQALNPPCPHIRRAHVESPFQRGERFTLICIVGAIGEFIGLQVSLRPPFTKAGQGDFFLSHTPLSIGTYL
jgi:hypothetical protein